MDNNIKDELLNVINNIPNNITPIEKVRWVYVNFGKILSFDYKKFDSKTKANLDSDYINKYQTCVQISYLLNDALNRIDSNIKSEVIERKIEGHRYEQEHLANIVTINDEKYLLDLTLDLYRIHFDLKTKEFGFSGYIGYDLDIMPQSENIKMDEHLSLYKNGYTDNILKELEEEISFVDFSDYTFEEEIDYKILKLWTILNMNNTYSESNEFIYKILVDNFLKCETIRSVIRKDNEQKYVYIFKKNNEIVWYIYDENNIFYKSNSNEIKDMLDNGWINNKGLINQVLDNTQFIK